jgi:biopolymer transport protein ExbB
VIDTIYKSAADLMAQGGVVMWPLLAMSLLSATLVFERCWYFVRANHPGRKARVRQMARRMREGDHAGARAIAEADRSVYGRVVQCVLSEPATEAAAVDIIEAHRPGLERFMPTLSTIITVAPMLGILGTVLGIISSFQLLSDPGAVADPRSVSQGIAEALITTAAGLVIAILTLFPYNALRVQVERSLSTIEMLVWAVGKRQEPQNQGAQVAGSQNAEYTGL